MDPMFPVEPDENVMAAASAALPRSGVYKMILIAIGFVMVACFASAAIWFFREITPAGTSDAKQTVFEIKQGEGFRAVTSNLKSDHLIRSTTAFEVLALFGGHASTLKPGLYHLKASMTSGEILSIISGGSAGTATVTIPEGANIFEIDAILSKALVINAGDLIQLQESSTDGNLEGELFPDTYEFYTNADVKDVVKELTDNFDAKAAVLLAADKKNAERNLILASILEKEVPGEVDRKIVAGIILKRIAANMPIDIDATVCYAKLLAEHASSSAATTVTTGSMATNCPSLTSLDFKVKSPYNSYLYGGLPPGPIGNPGISAITAAMNPQSSPYWYYLSDPETGKTVFAKTLDEQTNNKVKYLESR